MNNKHTAKGIIVLLAIAIGYFLGSMSEQEIQVVHIEDGITLCFNAKYANFATFKGSQSPERSFIFISGSEVWTFVPCNSINWYE